ncbi:hypothetical protein [Bacillus sp. B-jedd]|uniref:hypothetical protein n=1 Tax=Bacillus sp. B-jedd TaxID=1476857 RepID=UPI000515547C|nr:hypothetical protein [Bacillus sp. B-jedd]CEG25994.1 hypothetical protein BN1002_00832 [Bacillus sp. B-jedd]
MSKKVASPRPSAPYSQGGNQVKNLIVGMPVDIYSCDGCGRAIVVEKDSEIAVCPYTDCGTDLYEYSHSGEVITGKASEIFKQQQAIIDTQEKRIKTKQERIHGLVMHQLNGERGN